MSEGVLHSLSFAKYADAFFGMLTSILDQDNSARRRLTSYCFSQCCTSVGSESNLRPQFAQLRFSKSLTFQGCPQRVNRLIERYFIHRDFLYVEQKIEINPNFSRHELTPKNLSPPTYALHKYKMRLRTQCREYCPEASVVRELFLCQ